MAARQDSSVGAFNQLIVFVLRQERPISFEPAAE
jgi:hypothetical protein